MCGAATRRSPVFVPVVDGAARCESEQPQTARAAAARGTAERRCRLSTPGKRTAKRLLPVPGLESPVRRGIHTIAVRVLVLAEPARTRFAAPPSASREGLPHA